MRIACLVESRHGRRTRLRDLHHNGIVVSNHSVSQNAPSAKYIVSQFGTVAAGTDNTRTATRFFCYDVFFSSA